MKNVIQTKAKENQRQSGGDQKSVSQKSDEPKIENMRTDEELSKLAGVSRDTIRKAGFSNAI